MEKVIIAWSGGKDCTLAVNELARNDIMKLLLCWGLSLMAILHVMVLTEEEHLHNAFGQDYKQYCKGCPAMLDTQRIHNKITNSGGTEISKMNFSV